MFLFLVNDALLHRNLLILTFAICQCPFMAFLLSTSPQSPLFLWVVLLQLSRHTHIAIVESNPLCRQATLLLLLHAGCITTYCEHCYTNQWASDWHVLTESFGPARSNTAESPGLSSLAFWGTTMVTPIMADLTSLPLLWTGHENSLCPHTSQHLLVVFFSLKNREGDSVYFYFT